MYLSYEMAATHAAQPTEPTAEQEFRRQYMDAAARAPIAKAPKPRSHTNGTLSSRILVQNVVAAGRFMPIS